jgi:signal transduction histidine kinase
MRDVRATALAVSAVAGAVTVTAALLPGVDVASRLPSLRAAIAMAPPLLALAAGLLVIGRLRRRARLNELILACSLGTLALSGLAFVAVPLLLQRFWPDLSEWAALAGSALGAVLFGLAAYAPRRRLRRLGPTLAWGGVAVIMMLLLIAVLAAAFAARWPVPVVTQGQALLTGTDLHADAVLSTVEVTVAAIYGLAATGFLRRSERLHDEFSGWLAISAVLAAAAHVNYFLHPALYLHFASVGDLFLLGFYVVLLGGSARQSWSYWRAAPEVAVLAERRRIARDLHDGPAQDLAYLLRNIDSLNGNVDRETREHFRRAAERAELDVRLAIDAIAAPRSESLNAAIAQAVGEVAARDHIKLELDFVPGIRMSPARADALVRIACEAVNNAARHSGAARVSLRLQHQGLSVRLRVSDDGSGFDTGAQADGFGLTSMRDRATSVGGDLRISSVPGRGTEVEVKL